MLEHACVYLLLNHFADFVVKTRWDGYIPLNPRSVRDNWYFDRREEIFPKVTSLCVIPSERVLVQHHKVVQ
jgi:hypothetical protein